jgi:hypothetical protein
MNDVTDTLDSHFEKYENYAKPIKCNELNNKNDIEKESYRIEQSRTSYKGMIKNVLESTAIYYTNKERMISLAVDVSNNLRDIIYIGLDNGKVLKIILNTYSLSKLIFQPILIQQLIIFDKSVPVTHLKIK